MQKNAWLSSLFFFILSWGKSKRYKMTLNVKQARVQQETLLSLKLDVKYIEKDVYIYIYIYIYICLGSDSFPKKDKNLKR